MALLKGTNPECDEAPVEMVRWDVRRVRRGVFLRERIEVSVHRATDPAVERGWGLADFLPVDIEKTPLTTDDCESLILATGTGDDIEVALAKVEWLVKATTPDVFAYVVDRLKGRLAQVRADRDRFAATIQEMKAIEELTFAGCKKIVQERDEAMAEAAALRDALRLAENSVRDCVVKGFRATWIRSADGETIKRGDNAFLGTDPECRLILIDCAEAICAENLRVVGLPEGVPVYAKRDNARAWKRSQRNPISSPVGSGAPAVPAMPTATASPSGIGDGADTAAGDGTLLGFLGQGAGEPEGGVRP